MTKEALAKLSTQELVNKYTMAKTIVWLFSIILILALLFCYLHFYTRWLNSVIGSSVGIIGNYSVECKAYECL
ncbi:hypothetical protein [Maribacter sp. 1_2014MBL_MicDiv]|uniref:hypothetical protein n=1 Tax=Maribacter sp. 1_2014MBL_MicDiv TaxID=1644130 RepID=UPI0008F49F86|nr:hypothetical protein [Maribacter sp. 1_2014MBL_MicDiv]APA64245.1 hypothetical protein YQ22_07880 [Maribacter sp. 1_2014MBL_MicDiv]